MNEKVYLFNPFNIKNWENNEVKEQFEEIIGKYNDDASTLYELSLNVENISNQIVLIGEMVVRYKLNVSVLKDDIKNNLNLQIYKQRDIWEKTHEGKTPAMSYFEALANDFVKESRNELREKECDLERFQIFYESLENKMNAVKKKMEAVKYEEFGC